MSARIKHQVIEKDGMPIFVVVPYDEYINLVTPRKAATVPHEVVKRYLLDEMSVVRAWREYLKLTQREVAGRMGITQAAYAQMEKVGVQLKQGTLVKIAAALGVTVEQLSVE